MNPYLLSALLTGGGALVNYKIQNDAIKAQNFENRRAMEREAAAAAAERARQQGMEAVQADLVAKALMQVDPAKAAADVETRAEAPDNEFVQSAETYNVPVLPGQDAASPVAGDIGKIVADRLQATRGILKAQSKLSDQSSSIRGNQDTLTRLAGDLTNIGSDRQGSLNVSRMETAIPAARVTPSSSPIGDLMMLGGMLYGNVAGAGQPVSLSGTLNNIFGNPTAMKPSGLPAIY